MAIGVGISGPRGGGGGGGGSLAVSLSNSTPDYGDTVTITATPTGITPTSYTYILPDGTRVTQAGNTYAYVVNESGSQKVIVTATDDVDTVTDSVDLTIVTIYAKHGIDHAWSGEDVTLVGGVVDEINDLVGSIDATAPSAATRPFFAPNTTDAFGQFRTESTRRLETTLSTLQSTITIFGVFINDGNPNRGASTVSSLINGDGTPLSGAGSRFGVLTRNGGADFSWNVRDSGGGLGANTDIALATGKNVFVATYDGTTLRLNYNGTILTDTYSGALYAQASNFVLVNSIFSSYNTFWAFPTLEVGVKLTNLSTTEADQLYSDLLVKYPN